MCLTTETKQTSFLPLGPPERRTLRAVCRTLVPTLASGEGDDPELFRLSADALNVAGRVELSLAALDPEQQKELRTLLRLLEQPLFIALLIHRPKGFSRLARADRRRVLQALAVSRWEKLRTGFQALKRLALFTFYSAAGTPSRVRLGRAGANESVEGGS
jgi:hypothetical protein